MQAVNIGVIATLLAAIAGAILKWVFDIRLARQKNAFEMHKDLHSKEMLSARSAAWDYVRDKPTISLYSLGYDADHAKNTAPLWQVMEFFHRVWVALDKGYIPPALVFPLFGELAVWWYFVVVDPRSEGASWESMKSIRHLVSWIEAEAHNDPRVAYGWNAVMERIASDAQANGLQLMVIKEGNLVPTTK